MRSSFIQFNAMITHLTPEQKALIPVYYDKWRKVALSTKRIDRLKTIEAVKAAYRLVEQDELKFYLLEALISSFVKLKRTLTKLEFQ